jgi:ketosteroid isomerase-like protein
MTTKNIEVVQGVYGAFPRGDMQAILDAVDADVTWGIESVATGDVKPYGIRRGKDGVASFFADWGTTADFHTFEATDFVAAGDHVFCYLRYEITVKKTGKRVSCGGSVQHWTLKNGKIVRWRGFEDTAATRDAFR